MSADNKGDGAQAPAQTPHVDPTVRRELFYFVADELGSSGGMTLVAARLTICMLCEAIGDRQLIAELEEAFDSMQPLDRLEVIGLIDSMQPLERRRQLDLEVHAITDAYDAALARFETATRWAASKVARGVEPEHALRETAAIDTGAWHAAVGYHMGHTPIWGLDELTALEPLAAPTWELLVLSRLARVAVGDRGAEGAAAQTRSREADAEREDLAMPSQAGDFPSLLAPAVRAALGDAADVLLAELAQDTAPDDGLEGVSGGSYVVRDDRSDVLLGTFRTLREAEAFARRARKIGRGVYVEEVEADGAEW